jgi:hypothetical protein
MYEVGLGFYREQVLKDLNEGLEPRLKKNYPERFFDIQKTFRVREDRILTYSLKFMESWEPRIPRKESRRNKTVEVRHRKNMIDREISSRGLGKKGF